MGAQGSGSIRERHTGVFEIRVAVGVDPLSGRTLQRSFSFHGTRDEAEARRSELAAEFAEQIGARQARHDERRSLWRGARGGGSGRPRGARAPPRSDPSRFASAFSTRALLVAISAVTCSADTWSGHRDASTTLRNYADALPLEDERIRSNERFSASNANLSLSRSKVADDLMEQLACHAGFRRRVHKASSGAKCSLDVHGPNSFRPATRPSDRRADVPATGRSVRFVVARVPRL